MRFQYFYYLERVDTIIQYTDFEWVFRRKRVTDG